MTGVITLINDVVRIDGCVKLHKFSAILAWLFVF